MAKRLASQAETGVYIVVSIEHEYEGDIQVGDIVQIAYMGDQKMWDCIRSFLDPESEWESEDDSIHMDDLVFVEPIRVTNISVQYEKPSKLHSATF